VKDRRDTCPGWVAGQCLEEREREREREREEKERGKGERERAVFS
jgi:hypothetical protein